jgi:hypothetical protein
MMELSIVLEVHEEYNAVLLFLSLIIHFSLFFERLVTV